MKLLFKKIRIKNFLSFEDQEFDFDNHVGMTLIIGKNNDIPGSRNGAGKSNLFSSLVYCLFGEMQNGIKKSHLPNRVVSDIGTEVSLEFLAGKNEYRIERGLAGKSKNAYCNIKRRDGDDWTDITKSSIALTQTFINTEIIRIDMPMFLRSILLTTDQSYNFFRLNASQKREFIENLFGLDFYKKIYAKMHQDLLEKQKGLSMAEYSRNNLLNLIEDYKRRSGEELAIEEEKRRSLEFEMSLKMQKLREKEVEEKLLLEKMSNLSKSRADIKNSSSNLLKEISSIKMRISAIESDMRNTKTRALDLKSRLSRQSEYRSKFCGDCVKVFDEMTNFSNGVETIKGYRDVYRKLRTEAEEASKTLKEKEEEYKNGPEREMVEVDDELSLVQNQRTNLFADRRSIMDRISAIKNELSPKKKENAFEELKKKAVEELEQVENDIKNEELEISYLETAESVVSQDTIRKFIVSDMLGILNDRISYYLNKIGARYTCIFDDNLDYIFITESGETEYNNFSSGERARLSIATSFAFRDFMATRSGISSNILVLDEYMDSNLDSLAIDGLLKILSEFLVLYNQRIYVISHRHEVDESIFKNIVEVEKTNGVSTIRDISE